KAGRRKFVSGPSRRRPIERENQKNSLGAAGSGAQRSGFVWRGDRTGAIRKPPATPEHVPGADQGERSIRRGANRLSAFPGNTDVKLVCGGRLFNRAPPVRILCARRSFNDPPDSRSTPGQRCQLAAG